MDEIAGADHGERRAANRHDAQKAKSLTAVDRESNQKVVSYFRSHSKKAIIKYVDLTQGVNAESFSRNYPWFNAITIPLSTYGGYDWHLSRRSDYGRRMSMDAPQGRWVMRPDWEYVANTGADFVLFEEGNPLNDAKLADVADKSNFLRNHETCTSSDRESASPSPPHTSCISLSRETARS